MASIPQIQKATAKFLDEQIAGAFSGWDKTFVCGTGALLAAGLPKILKAYEKHPLVAVAIVLGAYDPTSGVVNIDMLYEAYAPYFSEDKMLLRIPFINQSIKIGKREVEQLIRYIKEA